MGQRLGDRLPLVVTRMPARGALFRQVGDRYEMADSLASLGDTYAATGLVDQAQAAWQRAVSRLDILGVAAARWAPGSRRLAIRIDETVHLGNSMGHLSGHQRVIPVIARRGGESL